MILLQYFFILVFTLTALRLSLCSNSAIEVHYLNLTSTLNALTSGQWWLPNGLPTATTSNEQLSKTTSSIVADDNQLKRFKSNSHTFTPGVYTYQKSADASLTMIGIYTGGDENGNDVHNDS